jgi:hypothetical protein
MIIKQFAYYSLGSGGSKSKRDLSNRHHKRHDHQRFHDKYARDAGNEKDSSEKRAIGDMVTATINGQVVSWVNAYDGGAVAATEAPAAPAAPQDGSGQRVDNSQPNPDTGSSGSQPAPQINPGAGNWGRQAYYNSDSGEQIGLAVMNNKGGDACSGTFDYSFGNSLSYASSDGATCASSPQKFNGNLGDAVEVVFMADKPCQGNDCGFTRPKTAAHHGFGGATKMFLIEFSMPLSGGRDFNQDMPAAWILNAQIPNVMQYASPPQCSCWTSGCGEWDIFEVLDAGNKKCKSTWHGGPGKSYGDSNWFERPVSGTKKAAVIMDGDSATGTIMWLSDDATFDEVIPVEKSNGYASNV